MPIHFAVQRTYPIKPTLRQLHDAFGRHRLLFAFYARAYRKRGEPGVLSKDSERATEIKINERSIYHILGLDESDKLVERSANDVFEYRESLNAYLLGQHTSLPPDPPIPDSPQDPNWGKPRDFGFSEVGWYLAAGGPAAMESSALELLDMAISASAGSIPPLIARYEVTKAAELIRPRSILGGGEAWRTVKFISRDYPDLLAKLIFRLNDMAVIQEAFIRNENVNDEQSQSLVAVQAPPASVSSPGPSPSSKAAGRKPPTEDAFCAYRCRLLMGQSQKQIAKTLTGQLKRPVDQGTVSRWLKSVERYLHAGNPLPDPLDKRQRPHSVDPATIDMGERVRRTTSRQRGQASND